MFVCSCYFTPLNTPCSSCQDNLFPPSLPPPPLLSRSFHFSPSPPFPPPSPSHPVYVVGVTIADVILAVFAAVAFSIVSVILSAIFRGRGGPPAPNPPISPPIIRNRPTVAGFITFLVAIATTLFQGVRERVQMAFPRQPRPRARMSSSNETPGLTSYLL